MISILLSLKRKSSKSKVFGTLCTMYIEKWYVQYVTITYPSTVQYSSKFGNGFDTIEILIKFKSLKPDSKLFIVALEIRSLSGNRVWDDGSTSIPFPPAGGAHLTLVLFIVSAYCIFDLSYLNWWRI